MAELVGALDQGTTSTRFMVFDHDGGIVTHAQLEHDQHYPRPGWVEHDPLQLWERVRAVTELAMRRARLRASDLVGIGVTNQRETTVVWDRRSGLPFCNAIVWQDTRTDAIIAGLERDGHAAMIRARTGLAPATYFSGAKLQWILEHVDGVRRAAQRGDALFGTIDSWIVWNLTAGRHITDVTNASRTMCMDLHTLDWDSALLAVFDTPRSMFPEVRASSSSTGDLVAIAPGTFGGEVPIAAVLGDQHAALLGQVCIERGDTKNTYGTGSFVLLNTGSVMVESTHGLLTTLAFQLEHEAPRFALEGSVAVAGGAIGWLRDQLGLVARAADVDRLAAEVDDTAGLYVVPAFSGLFAPHWRPDARGVIVGISAYHGRAHLARAVLEAICYQSRDVLDAMAADAAVAIDALAVDGGVSASALCMQLQADVLGIPVVRPAVLETTALGAAFAAGLALGFWRDGGELRQIQREAARWEPSWSEDQRAAGYAGWKKALERTLDWVDVGATP